MRGEDRGHVTSPEPMRAHLTAAAGLVGREREEVRAVLGNLVRVDRGLALAAENSVVDISTYLHTSRYQDIYYLQGGRVVLS